MTQQRTNSERKATIVNNTECQTNNVNYTGRKIRNLTLDELPYEVWMKFLIKAYRKDKVRLEQLQRYADGLEEENVALQKQLDKLKKTIGKGHFN